MDGTKEVLGRRLRDALDAGEPGLTHLADLGVIPDEELHAFGVALLRLANIAVPEDEEDRRTYAVAAVTAFDALMLTDELGGDTDILVSALGTSRLGPMHLDEATIVALRREVRRVIYGGIYDRGGLVGRAPRARRALTTAEKFPERALSTAELLAVWVVGAGSMSAAERQGVWDAATSPDSLLGNTPREREADHKRRVRGRSQLRNTSREDIVHAAIELRRRYFEQNDRIEQLLIDLNERLARFERSMTSDELAAYLQGVEDARRTGVFDPEQSRDADEP